MEYVPFVSASSSPTLVSVGLLFALLGSAYSTWLAVHRWGQTQQVVSKESRLSQSDQLSALWYSSAGELYGYWQEGWRVTLVRWQARSLTAPDTAQLDLKQLMALDRKRGSK
jgi:hypothetical protein